MTEEIINKLVDLKENPRIEKIDHISILHNLYWKFSQGVSELKPIAAFYVNGFDDLPALKEKHLWNGKYYNDLMKPFFDAHSELVEIINEILIENGN